MEADVLKAAQAQEKKNKTILNNTSNNDGEDQEQTSNQDDNTAHIAQTSQQRTSLTNNENQNTTNPLESNQTSSVPARAQVHRTRLGLQGQTTLHPHSTKGASTTNTRSHRSTDCRDSTPDADRRQLLTETTPDTRSFDIAITCM